MRKSASRNREKYSSGIVEEDGSLAKYNGFLANAGIKKTFSELAMEMRGPNGIARVLDLGCGNGKALWELKKEMGKSLWACGIDLVEPKFGLDEKITGDALEEKFPEKMNLIVSFRALHEIGFPEKILKKCCSVLASKGKAVLSFRAMEAVNGKLVYCGEMKAEDIEFLEAVIEEKRFGKCRAHGKTIYVFEDAVVKGKPGKLAFISGINVFLEKD